MQRTHRLTFHVCHRSSFIRSTSGTAQGERLAPEPHASFCASVSRRVLATRSRLRYRPDGYQIVIEYRADVMVCESDNRLRPAGSTDKFHLERFCVVDLHNCTEITLSQSVLRKISIEYDSI